MNSRCRLQKSYITENYETTQRRAKRAEVTSQLTTDDDTPKRKSKRNRRYFSDSEQEDDSGKFYFVPLGMEVPGAIFHNYVDSVC